MTIPTSFVIPSLYGVSITINIMSGEIYSDTTERGWWIRNKAIQLLEKQKFEFDSLSSIPSQQLLVDMLTLATRYSTFWHNHKKYKSIYSEEIMKEITT